MPGLFGALNMGSRSLQAQQAGIETAGLNLANVNNPNYARQRVTLETDISVPTKFGLEETGVTVVGITQIRDALLDRQITSEMSVAGYWETRREALESTQANLGQMIDRHASGPEGAAAASGTGAQQGISEGLQDLFNSFQSLSTDPAALAERQVLLQKAASMASRFNQTDARLSELATSLDANLSEDVKETNRLMGVIANLNDQISTLENQTGSSANRLRDLRQARLEDLAQFVDYSYSFDVNNQADITIGGVAMVTGKNVTDTLEVYDAGGGQMLVRAATAGTALPLTGGSIQGTIDTRDTSLANLRSDIDSLAALLITEVNAVHAAGFSLTGSTGAAFFTGTGASDIAINTALQNDPQLIQTSALVGAVGNNATAVALAQLADKRHGALSGQTFSEFYNATVSTMGQDLASSTAQVTDQSAVQDMLLRQRDSVSGVSVDEEMTDLVKYQRAFQASAKFINTIDQLMETVISLKR